MFTGWNDAAEGVLGTLDYYETAEKIVGSRAATQAFLRLFIVPGMNHCEGGDGAYAIDYLGYLEEWVERSQAPDKLIGAHLKDGSFPTRFPLDPANVVFSRPVYPYPIATKYRGRGDPKEAASFAPQEP
jgi:hypothetical protein